MKLPLVLLLAALGAVLLPPPAEAQLGVREPTLTVSVTDPGEDLVPTRPTSLEIRVRYAFPPGSFTNEPVTVTLEVVRTPPWATPKLDQTVIEIPLDAAEFGPGGDEERIVLANLTLDPAAPARTREGFVVKATSRATGNLAAAENVSPEVNLQAAFIGLLDVAAPDRAVVPGGRATRVTFTVTNAGNGDTPVGFKVTTQPRNSIVEAPGRIDVPRGESRTVDVTIRVPWTTPERGLLVLQATPERAGADAKPFVGQVAIDGRAAIPAGGLVAVAALAAVAVLARRR